MCVFVWMCFRLNFCAHICLSFINFWGTDREQTEGGREGEKDCKTAMFQVVVLAIEAACNVWLCVCCVCVLVIVKRRRERERENSEESGAVVLSHKEKRRRERRRTTAGAVAPAQAMNIKGKKNEEYQRE